MIFSGSDVIGDGVNIASRLQEHAQEGCINISASVYRDIKNQADIQAKLIGEKYFKNVDEPIKVYRVLLLDNEFENPDIDYQKIEKTKQRLNYYLIIGVTAAILIIILILKYIPNSDNVGEEKSIAVLPFKNLSEDQSNQHFCDGIMEGILNHLSKIDDLRVASRSSTENIETMSRKHNRL